MIHVVACCQRNSCILPYICIIAKVFKAFGINLTLESDVEEPSHYKTYNNMSMGRMNFEKVTGGSWVRQVDLGAKYDH